MRAQDALKAALRDRLGPVARSHGYMGSSPNWRKHSADGDWAVVNVQSSTFSSAEHLRCLVNLGFAPEPWLRWSAEQLGSSMPRTVSESLGLYRKRLHPEGTPETADGWWDVTDEASACAAVDDMIMQLDRDGWPVLERMFDRGAFLLRLQEGDLGFLQRSNFGVSFARAEALMLMDSGPSDALDAQLDYALSNVMPIQRESAEHFDSWVRSQAAMA